MVAKGIAAMQSLGFSSLNTLIVPYLIGKYYLFKIFIGGKKCLFLKRLLIIRIRKI